MFWGRPCIKAKTLNGFISIGHQYPDILSIATGQSISHQKNNQNTVKSLSFTCIYRHIMLAGKFLVLFHYDLNAVIKHYRGENVGL